MMCPKCESKKYYYDGVFIQCNACGYIEWLVKDGELVTPDAWGYTNPLV